MHRYLKVILGKLWPKFYRCKYALLLAANEITNNETKLLESLMLSNKLASNKRLK